jgi:caffeoyl-CoA O-methyltransferase
MTYAIQLEALYTYCDNHSSEVSPYLHELERQTYLQTVAPQMISGRMQGRFLSMISRLKQPRYILEIGTFTGYSALCLAEGLTPDGELHTIEISNDFDHILDQFAKPSVHAEKITWHKGDAEDIIPNLDKLKPGCILIADNVLWYGKVLDVLKDEETAILDKFNKYLKHSKLWETQMFPLRDGLSISIKI